VVVDRWPSFATKGIDRDPALPQPIALLPGAAAYAHRTRLLIRQPHDRVRVRLEIEPPRGMALIEAVHRQRDEVGTVFEVADDDVAFSPVVRPTVVRRNAPHQRLFDLVHRNRPPLSR